MIIVCAVVIDPKKVKNSNRSSVCVISKNEATNRFVTVSFVFQVCAQRHEEHKEDILVLSTDFTD
jgi:hypothetical protein